MQPLWTRRSVIIFFLVGFGVPWIGWTTIALTGLELPSPMAYVLFYTGDFMTVAGFVAVYVAAGGDGLKSLFRRFIQIRTSLPWVLFALFLPLTWTLVPGLIWALTHDGIGQIRLAGLAAYFAPGVLLALTTGPLGEEAGWRGFLQPRMLQRYSPLKASLIIGLIWSIWHYPLYWDGVFSNWASAVNFTIGTLCFSVLMTVQWGFTRASVFWAIILHWTINISERIVGEVFPDVNPPEGALDWLQAATLIAVTAIVFLAAGKARLEKKLAEAMDLLGDEAISADRQPG